MNVNVQMVSGFNDMFEMLTVDTVLDVKKRVKAKENIELILIQLLFNGKEVHDVDSLESIKKLANSNDILLQAIEREEITVQMTNGNQVNLEMDPSQTILDVKKKI